MASSVVLKMFLTPNALKFTSLTDVRPAVASRFFSNNALVSDFDSSEDYRSDLDVDRCSSRDVSSGRCGFCLHPFSGISYAKLPTHIQKSSERKFRENRLTRSILTRVSKARPQYFIREGFGKKYALLVGRDRNELRLHKDQFWVEPMKEAFSTLKSLFEFLAEQPSQLKHIEWPSFATTLKTATFTLVLVGLLIVALSSVDAALWYLLALLLRKPA